jgi:hypothetical protein
MPWISTAVSVGSNLLGGVIGSRSARKAQEAQARATREAMGVNQGVLDSSLKESQPYLDAGGSGLSRLLSQQDEFNQPLRPDQVMAEPGYQFGLQQGQAGIEGGAAAAGGLYSGAALKELQKFGTDYATTKYGQAFDRLRGQRNDATNRSGMLAEIGQRAQGQRQNAQQYFGGVQTGLITGQGNANAASRIAQGNAWGDAIQGAGYGFNKYLQPGKSAGGGSPGGDSAYDRWLRYGSGGD